MKTKYFIFFNIFIFITICLSISPVRAVSSYSKSFETNNLGDIINFNITRIPSSFETKNHYEFAINLTAVAFRSNQVNFNAIYLDLRLFPPTDAIVYGELIGPFELDKVGGTINTSDSIFIPNKAFFGLGDGQSLSANLEYKFDYNIGFNHTTDLSYTSKWKNIEATSIYQPRTFNFQFISFYVMVILGLLILVIILYSMLKNTIKILQEFLLNL